MGFALNIILASQFGSGSQMDCYLTAITVPIYIITILSGSLSVTFIPVFNDNKDPAKRWTLFSSLAYISTLVGVLITMLLFVFSSEVIHFLSPAFSIEMVEYSASLLKAYSYIIFLTILNEILSGVFYSYGYFIIPVINKIISPVLILIVVLLLGKNVSIVDIIYANVVGTVVQNIILLWNFNRQKEFQFYFYTKIFTKEVLSVGKLILPLLAGAMFYKLLPVFDKYLLSHMPVGSVSSIGYSQKVFFALSQILSSLISMQVFSYMSRLFSENRMAELVNLITKIINVIAFITIPISTILIVFSYPMVELLYERGKFTIADTEIVSLCLKLYLLSFPGVILGTIISQGLYVLKDTKSPFIVGLIEVALYIILCRMLAKHFNIMSLPISYVVYFYFSVIILGIILQRKIKYLNSGEFVVKVLKFVLLILIISLAGYAFSKYFDFSTVSQMIVALICFLCYITVSYMFGFDESRFLIDKIKYELFAVFKKQR